VKVSRPTVSLCVAPRCGATPWRSPRHRSLARPLPPTRRGGDESSARSVRAPRPPLGRAGERSFASRRRVLGHAIPDERMRRTRRARARGSYVRVRGRAGAVDDLRDTHTPPDPDSRLRHAERPDAPTSRSNREVARGHASRPKAEPPQATAPRRRKPRAGRRSSPERALMPAMPGRIQPGLRPTGRR
jgi:hypothetical protein